MTQNRRLGLVVAVLIAGLFGAGTAYGSVIVAQWQFNTPGDVEGWTLANVNSATNNPNPVFTVQDAFDASAVVLTGSTSTNNDPQLRLDNLNITRPVAGWDSMVIRVRQLNTRPDADPASTRAWDATGTILLFNTFSSGGVSVVPGNGFEDGGAAGSVSRVSQDANWELFTIDLSGFTEGELAAITRIRFDPMGGADSNQKGFEVDYIVITGIPEPASLVLMGLGGLAMLSRRKSAKQ